MKLPKIVVFAGPTISAAEVKEWVPGVQVRPPAERGDLLREAMGGARVLGLVDGYFEHRYSVQHKEILWALDRGISVYGAASMGALRASELACFGMIGVGRIFSDLVDRRIERDDEVALFHGPAPEYRAVSEPLVNLVATLEKARSLGTISAPTKATLIDRCRKLYYADLSFERLRKIASEAELGPRETASLSEFLGNESNWVNQKLEDAREMLMRMRRNVGRGALPAKTGDWSFPWTSAWDALFREVVGTGRPPE